MAQTTSHSDVLDVVGSRIVQGTLPPGSVMTLDQIQVEFGISRTVAREIMRILEAMSLIESRRRVGLIVKERSQWSVFNPQIVRWRLAGADRDMQLRWLTELRVAIEPWAANLAASNTDASVGADLLKLSGEMRSYGELGDLEAFLDADVRFHTTLLQGSGNEMFAALSTVVAEVLAGRTHLGLMPHTPLPAALDLHDAVARAIVAHDGHAAMTAMSELLGEVRSTLFNGE